MQDEKSLVALIVKRRQQLPVTPSTLQPLSREKFIEDYGVDEAAEKQVIAWAKQRKLAYRVDSARRAIFVVASEELLNKDFGVVEQAIKGKAARLGVARLPPELSGSVVAVLGRHTEFITDGKHPKDDYANGHGSKGTAQAFQTAAALRKRYAFPNGQGEGQCVGVIELKGGYRQQDVHAALEAQGISTPPKISNVIVKAEVLPEGVELPAAVLRYTDGANSDPQKATVGIQKFLRWMRGKDGTAWAFKDYFEVVMDVSLVAMLAPKADIQVYFGNGDSVESFLYLLEHAVLIAEPRPTVLSVSWSFQERQILNGASDTAAAHQIDELLQAASMMGVTVCCASGDWGATNQDFSFSGSGMDVAFPASSPWALACGGTTLLAKAGEQSAREVVWNHDFPEPTADSQPLDLVHGATGGGYSKLFASPPWQPPEPGAPAGRGTPDVAAVADPRCGIDCQILGNTFPSFGTSASAPIWAGLVAVLNAELGVNVGCLNPLLHAASDAERAAMFTAITEGDNKMNAKALGFEAGPGWNPCTGFGTPRGRGLLEYLKKLKGA